MRGKMKNPKIDKKEKKPLPKQTGMKPKKPTGCPLRYTQEWIDKEADVLMKWIEDDKGIYLGTFAFERGYGRQRLLDFEKKSTLFAVAMEHARNWQEQKFLTKGLTREWDAAQVRYAMARICGDLWKASWDKEDADRDLVQNITINEIRK